MTSGDHTLTGLRFGKQILHARYSTPTRSADVMLVGDTPTARARTRCGARGLRGRMTRALRYSYRAKQPQENEP